MRDIENNEKGFFENGLCSYSHYSNFASNAPGFEMFAEMVETIQTLVRQTSYPLFVDYMDEDGNEVRRAIRLCREQTPLGILFLGGNMENLRPALSDIDVPCVLVTIKAGPAVDPSIYSSVIIDDMAEMRKSTEYLIKLGHRRIGCIYTKTQEQDTPNTLRVKGYMQALEAIK